MMTREEAMIATDDKQKEKIKTPFAKVIVEGRGANSYFSILYFDPADKDFCIGYSSYYLDYVFNWLNEKFEIVEDGNFTLSALRPVSREPVERMRGEWIAVGAITCKCSRCQHSELSTRANEYLYCPVCGAPMTDEAVQMVMERLEALHETT